MKKRFKIVIHPLYYVVTFILFLTGHFKTFSIYTSIILFHELGHVFAGLILKWPINRITIYPFGCMTTFNNKINSSSIEEFLVLIYGPLFQIILYMIYPIKLSIFILVFNLLPIYPLDGSKLLLLFLNKIVSFYYSYIITYIISFVTIFILLLYNMDLISIIVLLFLLFDLYRYVNETNNLMYKFYYERYKNSVIYKKNKIIRGRKLHKMFKEKNNFFIINKKCYFEYDILRKTFDK